MIDNQYSPGQYIQKLILSLQKNPSEYEKRQLEEWEDKRTTEIVYRYETTSKVKRVAWFIFSVIIFPIAIYQIIHRIFGKFYSMHCFVKSNRKFYIIKSLKGEEVSRPIKLSYNEENNYYLVENCHRFVIKRIQLIVNDKKVDGMIYGRRDTIHNGIWTLVSKTAADSMENLSQYVHRLEDQSLKTNYLFFNYPGAGKWFPWPSKKEIFNTYQAMLQFLESKQGIGANKIICWGQGTGAWTQGFVLQNYDFQNRNCIVVTDRINMDSSSKSKAIRYIGRIVRFCGWKLDKSVAVSKKLEKKGIKEVILQTATEESPSLQKEKICGSKTLAHALLSKKPARSWKHKKFIGISTSFGEFSLPPFDHAGIIDILKT